MGRFWKFTIVLLLLICLPAGVLAASEATRVESQASVGPDGVCSVSLTMHLHLDHAVTDITFPLPAEATDVSLNNSFVTTSVSGSKLLVELPNLSAGDYTFTLSYRLPAVVSRENDTAVLTLPLLSGFGYPIRALDFTITLPGEIVNTPEFFSGYYQENIAASIALTIADNTLHGSLTQTLKDHETLVMTLPVPPEHFPLVSNLEPLIGFWDGAALLCLILAIAYYLIALMPHIPARVRCFTPPDGITAGEVGTYLTGTGVDLTLMVLSWAQHGYLRIEVRDKRKIFLHKQMEMGNERSQFEMRAFQSLFGNRPAIDGTGVHYARLHRKLAMQAPMMRQLRKPRAGSPLIFRLLSCAIGAICGVQLGLSLSEHPVLQVFSAIFCCILCGALSYFIQSGGKCLPLRNKLPLWLALSCAGAWIGLGFLAQNPGETIAVVLFQLFCGIAVAFGGRRSELGKRSLSQIWGLRHYMLHANNFELQQHLQSNSNFYYSLAPYALALGVDKRFARRFGKTVLPDCGFLILSGPQPATATQWAALLRQIVDSLDARQRRLPYERITGRSR